MGLLDILGLGGGTAAAPGTGPAAGTGAAPAAAGQGGFLSMLGLNDPEKRQRLGQGLIALGGSMMKAGGPSYSPNNFLGALGEGVNAFGKNYQGSADDAFKRAYTKAQLEHLGLTSQLQRQQLATSAKQQAAEQAYLDASGNGRPAAPNAPAAPMPPGMPQQPPAAPVPQDAPTAQPGNAQAAPAPANAPAAAPAAPQAAPAVPGAPAQAPAGGDVTTRMQAAIAEQENLAMMAARAGNSAMAAQHKNNAQSIRDNAITKGIYMDPRTGQQFEVPGYRERELRKEQDNSLVKDGYKPLGPNGATSFVPGGPKDPNRPKDLSEGDKTAIRETDAAVQASQNSIASLKQLQALNEKAYSGPLANVEAFAARNDPFGLFDKDRGVATTMYNTETVNGVLTNLKNTFGGNPTEGERKIMLDVQASVDKSPAERKIILERAMDAANAKHSFNVQQQKGIRGGDYYNPDNAPNVPEVQPRVPGQGNASQSNPGAGVTREQAASAPKVRTADDFNRLPNGTLFQKPNGEYSIKP